MQRGRVWGFGSVSEFTAKAEPLYDARRQEMTTDISGLIKTTCQSGLSRRAAVCRVLYDTIRDGRCDLTHKNRINNESKKLHEASGLIWLRCSSGGWKLCIVFSKWNICLYLSVCKNLICGNLTDFLLLAKQPANNVSACLACTLLHLQRDAAQKLQEHEATAAKTGEEIQHREI